VKPKSAKAKFKPTKPKTTSIREDYPKVRIVKRRKGFAYQVDCRSKGWTGPAQPEFLTKKEALDKAREVAALIKDKGVEGAGSYTTLPHCWRTENWRNFPINCNRSEKPSPMRSPITWRYYGPINRLKPHHW
jgi:hypothetical protein